MMARLRLAAGCCGSCSILGYYLASIRTLRGQLRSTITDAPACAPRLHLWRGCTPETAAHL